MNLLLMPHETIAIIQNLKADGMSAMEAEAEIREQIKEAGGDEGDIDFCLDKLQYVYPELIVEEPDDAS